MTANTDDLRIQKTNELISPEQLIADIGVSDARGRGRGERTAQHPQHSVTVRTIAWWSVVGPCSIHDPGRRKRVRRQS